MKYVFTFNEINFGRIEVEADQKPDDGEIIKKILEGRADYKDTDFTEFRLIEVDGDSVIDSPGSYDVTITETLRKTVIVDADSSAEAEQTVNDNWRDSEYILDSDNFVGVRFEAVPTCA